MKCNRFVLCFAVWMLLFTTAALDSQAQLGGGGHNDPQRNRAAEAERELQSAINITSELMAGPVSGLTPAGSSDDLCKCVGAVGSPLVAKIENALAGPLNSNGLEFTETPLRQVIATLQENYDIPVQLDNAALDESGQGPDEPVTLSLHQVSLRSALRLMLQQLQLTYVIQDEVLFITTPEEAEAKLIVCVYDVRDLIVDKKNADGLRAIIDVIDECVASETWSANGGAAEIRPLAPGLLVISQTRAVHEEIRDLLATIRHLHKQPTVAVKSAVVPQEADTDRVVTRFYLLQMGEAANPEAVRRQIRDLITTSLPDEQWVGQLDNGQPVLLSVLPDRVVLRHKPAVQEQVRSLLVDSGVAAPVSTAHGEMGGRGGDGGAYGGYSAGLGEGGYGGGYGGTASPQPEPTEAN